MSVVGYIGKIVNAPKIRAARNNTGLHCWGKNYENSVLYDEEKEVIYVASEEVSEVPEPLKLSGSNKNRQHQIYGYLVKHCLIK